MIFMHEMLRTRGLGDDIWKIFFNLQWKIEITDINTFKL